MKNKVIFIILIVVVVIMMAAVYFFFPTTLGKNVKPSDVDHINVFDGGTGVKFTIENYDDIKYIIENIQSHSLKKDGISVGYDGFSFRINCVDKNGKNVIPEFIINGDDSIRMDPFFYKCNGGLCYDYLDNLEEKFLETQESNYTRY